MTDDPQTVVSPAEYARMQLEAEREAARAKRINRNKARQKAQRKERKRNR